MFSYLNGAINLENIVLILVVFVLFLFGLYFMNCVDKFIYENRKHIYEDRKIIEPSSVKLSGDLPLMEIDKEIDKFRQKHSDFEIILKVEDSAEEVH